MRSGFDQHGFFRGKPVAFIIPAFFVCLITFCTPSCISTYFKTPNDLYRTSGEVYLDDGTELAGEVTIQFETGMDAKKEVTIYHKETRKSETIPAAVVKYYKVRDAYYFPKKIDFSFNNTYDLLFLKRLTPENSRIQLYELHQLAKSTPSGEERKLFYISLANFSKFEVWSINDKKLYPNFEYKMGGIVADCPSLAEKIRARASGYSIPSTFASEAKRIEVYKRIIDEYNACQ